MRAVTTHVANLANDLITIEVVDEPGAGGANHEYLVSWPAGSVRISFQNGPIAESGVNGLTNEALLAIVQDRLEHFQAGAFACSENAVALDSVETALKWLKRRTQERMARGVEGKTLT